MQGHDCTDFSALMEWTISHGNQLASCSAMDRTNRGGWWSSEEKASRAELMLCGADEEAPLAYDVYKYGFTDRQAIKTTTIGNDRVRYPSTPDMMRYPRWYMLDPARGGS